MKQNFSSIYQLCDSGSGQILQMKQLYLSPGLAKIAPWCLAHRDNFSAEVSGPVVGWAAPPTLTAHTRGPLACMDPKICTETIADLVFASSPRQLYHDMTIFQIYRDFTALKTIS